MMNMMEIPMSVPVIDGPIFPVSVPNVDCPVCHGVKTDCSCCGGSGTVTLHQSTMINLMQRRIFELSMTDKTTNNIKNISVAKQMFELIAERSGEEDKANVFLDIIIELLFQHDDVWKQQQHLKYIAEVYGISPPKLEFGPNEDIPF